MEEGARPVLTVEATGPEGEPWSFPEKTLALVEGTGVYKWRVRAIGNLEGGVTNPQNWGDWAVGAPFFFQQPDEDKNWIYSRTFTEGGRVAEQLSFANGLQQLRQAQTRLSTSGQVIASQTLQDYAGRDALQSLPIPLLKSASERDTQLGFKPKLLLKQTEAEAYGPEDFDNDARAGNPLPAREGAGNASANATGYYSGVTSSHRMNVGVASAEGYFFTRTRFASDGTNRVVEQGGVGANHRIQPEGHTVRTFYSGASETELVRLFGKEAPKASKVTKTITLDPNNTASVSYQTEEGKVVATALSIGAAGNALDALTPRAETVILEEVNEKEAFLTGARSVKPILVTGSPKLLTVTYTLSETAKQAICGPNACATCDYQVEILLHNQTDPTDTPKTVLKWLIKGGSCTTGTDLVVPVPNNMTLQPGVPYLLEKRITAYNRNPDDSQERTFLQARLDGLRSKYELMWQGQELYKKLAELDPQNPQPVAKTPTELYNLLPGLGFTLVTDPEDNTKQYYERSAVGLALDPADQACVEPGAMIRIPVLPDDCAQTVPKDLPVPADFVAHFNTTWPDPAKWAEAFPNGPDRSQLTAMIGALKDGATSDPYYYNSQENKHRFLIKDLWQCWEGLVLGYEKTKAQWLKEDPSKPYNLLVTFLACVGASPDKFYTGSRPSGAEGFYRYIEYSSTLLAHQECVQKPGGGHFTLSELNGFSSMEQRMAIANCIRYGQPLPAGNTPQEYKEQQVAETREAVASKCENLRGAFKNAVIKSLHRQGFYVEGDAYLLRADVTEGYVLSNIRHTPPVDSLKTLCQVDATVEELVKNCQNDAKLTWIPSNPNDPAGPMAGPGTLGTEDELKMIKKVMGGQFELQVQPQNATSCSNATFIPANNGSILNYKVKTLYTSPTTPYFNWNPTVRFDSQGNMYLAQILGGVDYAPRQVKLNDTRRTVIASQYQRSLLLLKYSPKGILLWKRHHTFAYQGQVLTTSKQASYTVSNSEQMAGESAIDANDITYTFTVDETSGGVTIVIGSRLSSSSAIDLYVNDVRRLTMPINVTKCVLRYDQNGSLIWYDTSNSLNYYSGIDSGPLAPYQGTGDARHAFLVDDDAGNSYYATSPTNDLKTIAIVKKGTNGWITNRLQVSTENWVLHTITKDATNNIYAMVRFLSYNTESPTYNVPITLPDGTIRTVTSPYLLLKFNETGSYQWVRELKTLGYSTMLLITKDIGVTVGVHGGVNFYVGHSYVMSVPSDNNLGSYVDFSSTGDIERFGNIIVNGAFKMGNIKNRGNEIHAILKQNSSAAPVFLKHDKLTKIQSTETLSVNTTEATNYSIIGWEIRDRKLKAIVSIENSSTTNSEYINFFGIRIPKEPSPYSGYIAAFEHNFGSCPPTTTSLPVCFKWKAPVEQVIVPDSLKDYVVREEPKKCDDLRMGKLRATVYAQVGQAIEQALGSYSQRYAEQCTAVNSLDDNLKVNYETGQHHYTLYYYDRAGNLIKTVPPAGVDLQPVGSPTEITASKGRKVPHRMATTYRYNSLGQLVGQETPDGGSTSFYYNRLGQLRFSQNAQQKEDNKYAYTKYDYLGRVVEVGESAQEGALQAFAGQVETKDYPTTGNRQVTKTVYSSREVYPDRDVAPAHYLNGQEQAHVLNRVNRTWLDEDGDRNTTHDRTTTYYSYDPHGNVTWLAQEIPGLGRKYLRYEYDLISGKVLRVNYQEGQLDQFFHRYEYDADNRLLAVQTSVDGHLWEKDATYAYYDHGPLKRTVLGKDGVQGIDYTYTAQGWLKAINHPTLNMGSTNPDAPAGDPGLDGAHTARDAFGMSLSYYANDYTGAGMSPNFSSIANTLGPDPARNLYNGNIAAWASRTYDANRPDRRTDLTAERFTYDELNRIVASAHQVAGAGGFAGAPSATGAYATTYAYDANGNLDKLTRRAGNGDLMDNLAYHYPKDSNGKLTSNRLQHVSEQAPVSDAAYANDVDGQSAGNYAYDKTGNLTQDLKGGIGLNGITWTPYGKVQQVKGQRFGYDAAGNRVLKKLPNTSTYYVRDASGNVMGVYQKSGTDGMRLIEQPIYGSSRLGQRETQILLEDEEVSETAYAYYEEYLGQEPVEYKTVWDRLVKFRVPSPADLELSSYNRVYTGMGIIYTNVDGGTGLIYFEAAEGSFIPVRKTDEFTAHVIGETYGYSLNRSPAGTIIEASRVEFVVLPGSMLDEQLGYSEMEAFFQNIKVINTVPAAAIPLRVEGEVAYTTWPGRDVVLAPGASVTLSPGFSFTSTAGTSFTVAGEAGGSGVYARQLGLKRYELTDHLGNVRAVVSDRKLPLAGGGFGPDVHRYASYYAFGLEMPGKTGGTGYRYGFNGKEKDTEGLGGGGSTYDYGFRIYNPGIARFLSVDPLYRIYPELTTYQYASNNPIQNIDVDGLEGADYKFDMWQRQKDAKVLKVSYKELQQKENEHTASIFGYAVTFVPIIGDGLDAREAYLDYKAGNYGMAALGGISLIPGGDFIAKPLKFALKHADEAADLFRVGGKVVDNVDDFYKQANKLDIRERIPVYKEAGEKFADQNGWELNKDLMKKNKGRTIYSDGNGKNYSLDTQHGAFEVLDKKGKHQGEINFGNKITKKADTSGKHDINVK